VDSAARLTAVRTTLAVLLAAAAGLVGTTVSSAAIATHGCVIHKLERPFVKRIRASRNLSCAAAHAVIRVWTHSESTHIRAAGRRWLVTARGVDGGKRDLTHMRARTNGRTYDLYVTSLPYGWKE
jgi:hypothetical protein